MWTWFLLIIHNWIIAVVIWCVGRGGGWCGHKACLHTESASFDEAILRLTVLEMFLCSVFKIDCKVEFLFCLFIMQPWFYPAAKYCFNAICFTCFIFVNSVIVSSNISCNDLSCDFIIMYVWYSPVEIQYRCKVRYGLHWAHAPQ